MKIRRTVIIGAMACIAMLTIQHFWPSQLDPHFIVYGQSTGTHPCTACPYMTSITPASVTAGTTQLVSINGMNLNQGTLGVGFGSDVTGVVGNGTYTSVDVSVTATAEASLGARLITLSNSSGTAGAFCCVLVKSASAGPELTAVTPDKTSAGSAATDITLTGSGFDPSSVVRVNGADITTAFVNSTQLTAQIPASMLTATRLLGVTVASGNTTSEFRIFTVVATGAPVVFGSVPRGLLRGTTASGFVIGHNLLGLTSISVTGTGVAMSFGSGGTATHVPVSITVDSGALLGARATNVTTTSGTSSSNNNFVVAAEGRWVLAQPMSQLRSIHTATLLPSGRVLMAGGSIFNFAELYDSSTDSWTLTGAMSSFRSGHTATLLNDGKVLAAAGAGFNQMLGSCELYEPGNNAWTSTGSLNQIRYFPSATLLNNGKVLIAGGLVSPISADPSNALKSAELYDPSTGSWTATGNLNVARANHTGTLLPNGTVLVSGGNQSYFTYLPDAELYDPETGVWTVIQSLSVGRGQHSATLLPAGRVFVAGGNGSIGPLRAGEIYDSGLGTWQSTSLSVAGRGGHTATLLTNGKVLVVGSNTIGAIVNAELYDPSNNLWTLLIPSHVTRLQHTATLLPNGQVLVAGAVFAGQREVEIFDVIKKVRGQLTSQ